VHDAVRTAFVSRSRRLVGIVVSLVFATSLAVVVSAPAPVSATIEPLPVLEADEPTFRYIVTAESSADRISLVDALRGAGVDIGEEFANVLEGVAVELTAEQYLALKRDPRVASISRDKELSLESTLVESSGADSKDSDIIPGRYIIQTKPSLSMSAKASILSIIGEGLSATYKRAITGYAAKLNEQQIADLRAHSDVVLVEPDRIVRSSASQSNPTWGLDRIGQRRPPLDSTFSYSSSGAGVNAYVIDSGITSHPEFGNRLVSGYAAPGLVATIDENGHGTHVAGTIASTTWGVAKQATLVPVRVLDASGAGSTSGVVSGIDWVIGHHEAGQRAVANMSLGGGASDILDRAVRNLVNDGVVVVVAAGNDNADACGTSPARESDAITVGSTTSADERSSFSNFGACLDIFAPGSEITSTWPDGGTSVKYGTSMASPHVAGAVAAYWSDASNASKTSSELVDEILDLATVDRVSGAGAASANRLLYLPPSTGTSPGAPSNVVASTTEVLGAIKISWSAPSDVATNPVTSYSAISTDGSAGCLSSGTLGCSITGVAPGSYRFKVRAINDATVSQYSLTSNEVDFAGPGSNDYFFGSEFLDPAGGVVVVSNSNATREVREPTVKKSGTYRTLWYRYTPSAPGVLTIDLAGSVGLGGRSLDTVLGVYTGSSFSFLTKVAENDDEELDKGVLSSKVTTQVEPGVSYHVQVGSYLDTGGTIRMATTFAGRVVPNPPSNVIGTAGSGRIIVSWGPPVSSPELAINYLATAMPGGKQCQSVAPNTSCVITSLTNGVAYSLSVIARNSIGSSTPADSAASVTPSDAPTGPRSARTWALDRADQRASQLDGVYAAPDDGSEVIVYVVDTGIRSTHQEFVGRIQGGTSTVEGDSSVEDCHGHGTHVASSAAGASYGIANQAIIVPVRVLDCGGEAYTSGVIAGLEWVASDAAARRLPAVVNLSLGGFVDSRLDTAVESLVNKGIVVVAAAGNESDDACSVSPARTPRAITVGSSAIDDAMSSFSNTGACVDLFAPGSKIPGAGITSDLAEDTMSGTSMASPHVAGYAAVIRGMFPTLGVSDVTKVVVESASPNALSGLPSDTSNRLLYVATTRCGIATLLDVNCTTGVKTVPEVAPTPPSTVPSPPASAPVVQTPSVVAPSVITFATGRARFVEMKRSPTRSAASAPRVTVTRDVPVALRVPGLPRRSQSTVNVKSRHGSVVLGKVKVTKTGVLRLPKLSFSRAGVYTFSFKVGKRTLFAKVSVVRPVQPKVLSQRTVTVVQ
jgi:subtilisin family serine protease